ncbi:regulator with hipB [Escherichia coli]|nr:regulator with hipB [Escherichia coli]
MRHEKCLARINRTARSGVVMPKLVTWMNNQRVGELTKLANGAHTFKYAPEWLLRLPQEDMCQTFGLPSSVKYESDGGPGIARIMAFLMGSSEALRDRYDFMKFQVFQWLIGATDGHAKNFSVFIQAGGSYRLTPFYDIISAFPVLGGTGIHISDLKLAMGLNASKGKKTAIDKIYPRHFLATAKVLRFPEVQMHEILSDFARMIPAALDNVKTSLPTDFPENVVTAVETNVLRLHGRLSREYGSK